MAQNPPKSDFSFTILQLDTFAASEILTKLPFRDKLVCRLVNKYSKSVIDALLKEETVLFITEEGKVMNPEKQICGEFEERDRLFVEKTCRGLKQIGFGCNVELKRFENFLIEMREFTSITLDGNWFNDDYLRASIEYAKETTSLHLQNCSITEDGLAQFIQESSCLSELKLVGIPSVTGSCFGLLPSPFAKLELVNCLKIDGNSWTSLGTTAKNIKSLIVTGCLIDDSIIGLIGKFGKLTSIELDIPEKVSVNLSPISTMSKLEVMKIRDNGDDPSFNDKQFCEIVRGCFMLTIIHLVFKPSSTKVSITDTSLQDIDDNCPKLVFLLLVGLKNVTKKSFSAFGRCKKLQEIQLISLTAIDKDFEAMFESSKSLKKITFKDCKNVGKSTFTALLHYAKKTTNLWIVLTVENATMKSKDITSYFAKRRPRNLFIHV